MEVEEQRWSKLSRTARNGTALREVQAEWIFFESDVDCVMKRLRSWCLGFPPQPTTQAEPAAEPLFGAIRRRATDGSVAAIVGKGARGIGGIVARVRGGAGWWFRWSSCWSEAKSPGSTSAASLSRRCQSRDLEFWADCTDPQMGCVQSWQWSGLRLRGSRLQHRQSDNIQTSNLFNVQIHFEQSTLQAQHPLGSAT